MTASIKPHSLKHDLPSCGHPARGRWSLGAPGVGGPRCVVPVITALGGTMGCLLDGERGSLRLKASEGAAPRVSIAPAQPVMTRASLQHLVARSSYRRGRLLTPCGPAARP